MKTKRFVKHADTLGVLQGRALGYNHDHARFLYFGKTSGVPEHLELYVEKDQKYVFIVEEDIPSEVISK